MQLLDAHRRARRGRYATQHPHGPLPHRAAPRPDDQVEEGSRGRSPEFFIDRGRLQLRERAILRQPPAAGARLQHRAMVEQGVHQAPVVDECQSAVDVGILVEDQRLGDRRDIAIGMISSLGA